MPVGQRRQDADHHQVGADLGRLGLRVVEAAPEHLLERRQPALPELGRRDVDLDVELAKLGLERGVRDRRQGLRALQRRVAELVDEVQLDLQARHRVVGVEAGLAQHPGEHVEAAADLLAVAGAVGPGELLCVDLFAHAWDTNPVRAAPDQERVPRGGRHGSRQELADQPGERVVGVCLDAPVDRAPGQGAVAGEPAGEREDRGRAADVTGRAALHRVRPERHVPGRVVREIEAQAASRTARSRMPWSTPARSASSKRPDSTARQTHAATSVAS